VGVPLADVMEPLGPFGEDIRTDPVDEDTHTDPVEQEKR
jgi:hypothetical protein